MYCITTVDCINNIFIVRTVVEKTRDNCFCANSLPNYYNNSKLYKHLGEKS